MFAELLSRPHPPRTRTLHPGISNKQEQQRPRSGDRNLPTNPQQAQTDVRLDSRKSGSRQGQGKPGWMLVERGLQERTESSCRPSKENEVRNQRECGRAWACCLKRGGPGAGGCAHLPLLAAFPPPSAWKSCAQLPTHHHSNRQPICEFLPTGARRQELSTHSPDLILPEDRWGKYYH